MGSLGFLLCECSQCQGVNFATHQRTQGGVDHAVPCQGQFALKRFGNNDGFKVHAVFARYLGLCTGHTGVD